MLPQGKPHQGCSRGSHPKLRHPCSQARLGTRHLHLHQQQQQQQLQALHVPVNPSKCWQRKKSSSSKVAIFVEPSPFSHVSGMKNRFESLIRGLTQAGDEVMVFTPDQDPPSEFCGAKVGVLDS